jgi:hypothetical protein
MPDSPCKLTVALLTMPETTASAVFGIYDLFASVDRDWAFVTRGTPADSPFRVMTVAEDTAGFRMANGVYLKPDTDIESAACPGHRLHP